MLYKHNFSELFKKFIKASETGRRVKKNGSGHLKICMKEFMKKVK